MSSTVTEQKSKIQQFYEDKVVLLTGGTGFVGKVLIEKLLRSCPTIRKIYLIVREKNGVNSKDRLKGLLEDKVFLRMKEENPRFIEQLSVVYGDLHKPRLGLDEAHETLIRKNVDIVLHSAATIRFNEHFKAAISINVAGTKQLCLLAQDIINLKAFVYVSTAYSNCDSHLIQERVQPSPISAENLIKLSQLLEDPVLDSLAPSLLGSKPNMYIFTKCVAEEVVYSFKHVLPVAIIRPSIVISTHSEPVPGWIDNVQGPTGVVASMSAGLLHTMTCNLDSVANIVPVDFTVNAIIALAFSVAEQQWQFLEGNEGIPIINFVSTAKNKLTWRDFKKHLLKYTRHNPSLKLPWYPFFFTSRWYWVYALQRSLFHHIPATAIDFLSAAIGRPTRLRKLYQRMDNYAMAVRHFSTREFYFEEKNSKILWNSLELQDQQLFPFDMANIIWESYFSDYILGCREYLLKEDPNTIERARRKLKILYLIHLISKTTVFMLAIRIVWYVIKLSRKRNVLEQWTVENNGKIKLW